MAKKELVTPKTVSPKMDPSKSYRWEKTTEFKLTGEEFALMYNSINEFLTTPTTPQMYLKLADIATLLQMQLVKAVETGDAVEKDAE